MMIRTLIALIASIVLVACNNNEGLPQRSENDIIVDNIISQCKGYETKDIAQYISGKWEVDASLIYNEDWSTIKSAHKISGEWYAEGGGYEKYTFAIDGTGSFYFRCIGAYGATEEGVLSFEWQYDTTDKKLVLSGEFNGRYNVSGFNEEYIVLDYYVSNTNQYIREILKKVE